MLQLSIPARQDWKLVSSISATERIKLWNQFNDPVDQETVKANFLRKVNCKNPPFRYKLKPKPRICAEIPPMVEYHYRNPPPLLPSLRDVLRCERVYKRYAHAEFNSSDLNDVIADDLALINQRRGLISAEARKPEPTRAEPEVEVNGFAARKPAEEVPEEEVKTEEVAQQTERDQSEMNGFLEEAEPLTNGNDVVLENGAALENGAFKANALKAAAKRKRNASLRCVGSECLELLDIEPDEIKSKSLKVDPGQIDDELKCLDPETIKRLAFQQLNQLLHKNKDLVAMYQAKNANKLIAEALSSIPQKVPMPSQLLSADDIAHIAEQFANSSSSSLEGECDELNSLAKSKPHAEPIMYANCFNHLSSDKEKAISIAERLENPLRDSKIRARAVLTPVDDILKGKVWYTNVTIGDSVFMRYRSFSIGTNHDCQMRFGKSTLSNCCSRISPLHATIFYDEVRDLLSWLFISSFVLFSS